MTPRLALTGITKLYGEVPGVRGMPLGLPALSLEEIQLVESWVAQDRPE